MLKERDMRISSEAKKALTVSFKLAVLLLSLFLLALNNSLAMGRVLAVLLLVISFLNLWKSRNSIVFCVIFGFIFYCNYSICMVDYLNVLEGNFFTQWAYEPVSYKAIGILYLFNLILFLFSPKKKEMAKSSELSFFKREYYNPIIAWVAIFMALAMWFLGFSLGDSGVRGETSPIYEYAIILILFAFIYSGGNKIIVLADLAVVAFFCFFDLYSGNRAVAIQLVIMVFIVMISGGNKFKFKRVFPLIIIGLILFTVVGQIRGSTDFGWEMIQNAWKLLTTESFSLDTAYSAYYTSLTFIKVGESLTLETRLSMFVSFLKGIVQGFGSKEANLPIFTLDYYNHYGGGLIPLYFNFYLGILGVVLIGLYISFLLNKLCWSKSLFGRVAITYIACTIPRWYLYSPSTCLRGLLFVVIISIMCHIFNSVIHFTKTKRNSKKFLNKSK